MPCRPEHARALRPNASAVRRRGGRCRGAERAGRRPTAGLAAQAGRGCASPKLLLAGASASTAGAAGAHGTWVRLRASPSRGSGASAQREAPMRASPRFGVTRFGAPSLQPQAWGPHRCAPTRRPCAARAACWTSCAARWSGRWRGCGARVRRTCRPPRPCTRPRCSPSPAGCCRRARGPCWEGNDQGLCWQSLIRRASRMMRCECMYAFTSDASTGCCWQRARRMMTRPPRCTTAARSGRSATSTGLRTEPIGYP